jgi:hypothetical protein
MDDGLIQVQASAIRASCARLSAPQLLMCLRAGDPEGAAHEMETHLRVLSFMGHFAVGRIWPG